VKHKTVKRKKEKKEKKEKPKKEGKSGKQKQKQSQVVNIKINNGGGDGGGSSSHSRPPQQIPLNIFDPSLITPHFGISNRQPVNPPYPENVDMAGLLASLTSQVLPQRNDVTIKQNTSQSTENKTINAPIPNTPIKPIDVKPTPQANDFNINQIIENVKNKKKKLKEEKIEQIQEKPINEENIQDIAVHILPKEQELKYPLKPKYKDKEDLNMNIPVENVAKIGGAFLGGAALGGAALLTDMAYTGAEVALSELSLTEGLVAARARATVPSLISYTLGGGVGAGVNTALGGSKEAGVVASLVSGIISRKALNKYNQRQAAQQETINETTSLLGNAKPLGSSGKKLGGKKDGKSNLVPPSPDKKTNRNTTNNVK
jgi:hypothetical protein